jgi:hypothetical protein
LASVAFAQAFLPNAAAVSRQATDRRSKAGALPVGEKKLLLMATNTKGIVCGTYQKNKQFSALPA